MTHHLTLSCSKYFFFCIFSDLETQELKEIEGALEETRVKTSSVTHDSNINIGESGKGLEDFLSSGYVDVSNEKKSRIWTGLVTVTFFCLSMHYLSLFHRYSDWFEKRPADQYEKVK